MERGKRNGGICMGTIEMWEKEKKKFKSRGVRKKKRRQGRDGKRYEHYEK